MGNKKKKNRPQPVIQRQRVKLDEHPLCRTPGCRNVVAIWSKSNGYCTSCRRAR